MANTQTTVPKFTTLEVLSSADQNLTAGTGCPVFATTVTRDAAFGGANKVLAEGQICYLESTNVVQLYDGAAWQTVGPAPAASSGLTYITGGTFSTVSQGTVTGCFTSTYQNYRIMLNCTLWEGDSYLLFGTGGTISSATNTDWAVINQSGASVSGVQAANQGKALVCRNYSVGTLTIDIIGPNLADYTKYSGIYGGSNVGTSAINGSNGGLIKNNTQFTDFTIRGDAHPTASQSWTYKIYGYSNS